MAGAALPVAPVDRRLLASWARAGTTPQRVVRRATIVLLLADGVPLRKVARRLDVSVHTVALWRERYRRGGAASLWGDAPGRGRRPSIPSDLVLRVRELREVPLSDGRGWSIRRLARVTGLSPASVHRLVRRRGADRGSPPT